MTAVVVAVLHFTFRALRAPVALDDEAAEGVISTAIAVLIIALLGAGMWAAFQTIFDGATQNIGSAVSSIGS